MSEEEKASDKFDSWVRGMERVGLDRDKHYHPLLQIAGEMRDEIESLQARIKKLETEADAMDRKMKTSATILQRRIKELEEEIHGWKAHVELLESPWIK